MTASQTGAIRRVLLHDGALVLEAPESARHAVERWLPRLPVTMERIEVPSSASTVSVRLRSASPPPPPSGRPTFRLASVECWVDSGAGAARLSSVSDLTWGEVDLRNGSASIHLSPDQESAPARDGVPAVGSPDHLLDASPDVPPGSVFSMLTIASALLLGRIGRSLVHSGAIVAPDGGGWLLAGDTHSGKTTTSLNLSRAGWPFLSDDHVVLRRSDGLPRVEGWPRTPHVDDGWSRGEVTGRRRGVSLADLGIGQWQREAPLSGILFPRVRADQPTRMKMLTPGIALEKLIRQSPWLLADRHVAPDLLAMFQEAAALPAFELTLGRDSYASPARLVDVLAPPLALSRI